MKFPCKLIMHTERVIQDENMFNEWIDRMKSISPTYVWRNIKDKGLSVWETSNEEDLVKTTYKLIQHE